MVLLFGSAACKSMPEPPEFSGERAISLVEIQMAFGPRFPGSEGHSAVQSWIIQELQQNGWYVDLQEFDYYGMKGTNIISYMNKASGSNQEWVIIGAHYDTRTYADNDPDVSKQLDPVPGANDGASGVAVLLELARALPELENVNIWLVFFDGEDNGHINNQDWIQGSIYFVDQLDQAPDQVIIVDMIGDRDQNIYMEKSSDQDLTQEIWETAAKLERSSFIPEGKYTIIDDHTPFLRNGIPAIDIIDFDYEYWHTTEDTLDKISAESLDNVGDVLLEWLLSKN